MIAFLSNFVYSVVYVFVFLVYGSLQHSKMAVSRILSRNLLNRSLLGIRFVRHFTSKERDELFIGDYPVLPWRSAQLERPRGWWDDQDRRDKETPLHEEDDALNMWMYDELENNGLFTRWQALGQLLTMFGVLAGVFYLSVLYDAPSRDPAVTKEYPFNNLYLERGGDADLTEEEMAKNRKVHKSYGELIS
jgi:NADH dehydrogenase (ubiquinone) 1 beta subcomplex subunit 8